MTIRELLRTLSPVRLRPLAFWRRSWKHRAAGALLCIFCGYVGILCLLLAFENRLLYRGTSAASGWSPPPADVQVSDVQIKLDRATRLHGWWSTPAGWKPDDGALLFCHGNAGNLSHRGRYMLDLQKKLKMAVLMFDYPGYGRSTGTATEESCYAAGATAFDWLTENQGVFDQDVILCGGSLGGGVATEIALRQRHRALVLVSTFTSFADQAQTLYPWLPARWLVSNRFDNLTKLAQVAGPVFVAHGVKDDLIPFAMAERLYSAAREPKELFAMNEWGHADVLQPEALAALAQFLKENPPARRQAPTLR